MTPGHELNYAMFSDCALCIRITRAESLGAGSIFEPSDHDTAGAWILRTGDQHLAALDALLQVITVVRNKRFDLSEGALVFDQNDEMGH